MPSWPSPDAASRRSSSSLSAAPAWSAARRRPRISCGRDRCRRRGPRPGRRGRGSGWPPRGAGRWPGSSVGIGPRTLPASTSRATPVTRSTVNPNLSKIVPAGADAPKWSSPTIAPASPTQRSQPSDTPASTATRAGTSRGSTESRYAAGCRSNSSQQGSDTTRAGTPSRSSASAAPNASCSSEPVPIRTIFGAAAAAPRAGRSRRGRRRRGPSRPCPAASAASGGSATARSGRTATRRRARSATAQAAAASFASPGRMNHRFGIARSAA